MYNIVFYPDQSAKCSALGWILEKQSSRCSARSLERERMVEREEEREPGETEREETS